MDNKSMQAKGTVCPVCRGTTIIREKQANGKTKTKRCVRCRGTGKVRGGYQTK